MNDLEHATRFLATLRELDEPGFVALLAAILVIRGSDDVEKVRLAAKAVLRNQERLEEKLDDIKSVLARVSSAKTLEEAQIFLNEIS